MRVWSNNYKPSCGCNFGQTIEELNRRLTATESLTSTLATQMNERVIAQEDLANTLFDIKLKVDFLSIRTKPLNQTRASTPSNNTEWKKAFNMVESNRINSEANYLKHLETNCQLIEEIRFEQEKKILRRRSSELALIGC